MMAFNEQNTVEHFIIHQLTGVNLNAVRGNMVKEDAVEYDTVKSRVLILQLYRGIPNFSWSGYKRQQSWTGETFFCIAKK